MKIYIKNFKSINELAFETGRVNVLIGSNGAGKSAILEAIGVLSAAISDRVDDSTLLYRGVRLGTPALYKSSFKGNDRIPLTIEVGVDWSKRGENWEYKVNLNNPIDRPQPSWEYHSERLTKNGETVFGRSRATKYQLHKFPDIEIDKYKGLLSFLQGITAAATDNAGIRDIFDIFRDYAIYTPNTTTLRGMQSDPYQRDPIGLLGGRLAETIDELIDIENGLFGAMDIEEIYDLLGWVGGLGVGKPTKDMISPNVPMTSKTIRFRDRYMKEDRNELTPYDASEGALYVLFVLALSLHKGTPKMFAIDNFDHSMNPRLARAVAKIFCEQIVTSNKTAFITTHNPLVLDGLDLHNDDIRLFAVDRSTKGHTRITRIRITEELKGQGEKGYSLSKLWLMGRLGGVPNI